jgi:WD40 associated region in TFIID subunit, NTD2 domain
MHYFLSGTFFLVGVECLAKSDMFVKLWISESADHYKPELAQLLYPLFTHLYIRLLHCQAHIVISN